MNQWEIQELLDRGIAAAKAGNRQEARQLFERVLTFDSTSLEARLWLAGIADTPDEALSQLSRAVIIDPSSIRAQKGMQWALDWARQRRAKDAESVNLPRESDPAVGPGDKGTLSHDILASVRDLFASDPFPPSFTAKNEPDEQKVVDEDWLDILDDAFEQAELARQGKLDDPPYLIPLEERLEALDNVEESEENEPPGSGNGFEMQISDRFENLWSHSEEHIISSQEEDIGLTMSISPPMETSEELPAEAEQPKDENEVISWDQIMEQLKGAGTTSGTSDTPEDSVPSLRQQLESLSVHSYEEVGREEEPSPTPFIEELIARGKNEMATGRIEEAIATFKEVTSLRPDSLEAHEQLGMAFYQSASVEEALDAFRKVTQLKPDYSEAHANLGFLLTVQEKYEDAVRSYEEALKYNPELVEAHIGLAEVFRSLGKIDKAMEEWEVALMLKPDLTEALTNLAEAYAAKGQLDESVDCYRRAISYTPDNSKIHLALGHTLLKAGKWEEAADTFRGVLRLGAGLAEAHYGLGVAWSELGKQEEAIAALQQAIRLNPEYGEAKEALKSVSEKKNSALSRQSPEASKSRGKTGWWPFGR